MFQAFADTLLNTSSNSSSPERETRSKSARKQLFSEQDQSSSQKENKIDNIDYNKIIKQLQNDIKVKDSMINSMSTKIDYLEDTVASNTNNDNNGILKRAHNTPLLTHMIQDKGKITQSKVGTRGSVMTEHVLQALPDPIKTESHKIAGMFNGAIYTIILHILSL